MRGNIDLNVRSRYVERFLRILDNAEATLDELQEWAVKFEGLNPDCPVPASQLADYGRRHIIAKEQSPNPAVAAILPEVSK